MVCVPTRQASPPPLPAMDALMSIGSDGEAGPYDSVTASVSADGNVIAFMSFAEAALGHSSVLLTVLHESTFARKASITLLNSSGLCSGAK
jgi:hypothetical protein